MRQDNAKIGVIFQDPTCHQRRGGESCLKRKRRNCGHCRYIADPLDPGRMQRMNHNRHVQSFGFGKDGGKRRIAQGRTLNMRADLDPCQPHVPQPAQAVSGLFRCLQRHHPES